eukprot:360715-Amphidinium_carterae.3
MELRACSSASLGAGVRPLCPGAVCEAKSARIRRTSAPAWVTAMAEACKRGVSSRSWSRGLAPHVAGPRVHGRVVAQPAFWPALAVPNAVV